MGGEAKGTNVIFQYSVKPCENLKKCLGNNKQDEFEGTDFSLTFLQNVLSVTDYGPYSRAWAMLHSPYYIGAGMGAFAFSFELKMKNPRQKLSSLVSKKLNLEIKTGQNA